MSGGGAGEEPPHRAALVEEPEPVSERPSAPPRAARIVVDEPTATPETESPRVASATIAPATTTPATTARPVESGDAWARVLRAQGLPTVLRTLLTYLRPVTVDVAGGRIVLAGSSRHVESARGRHAQIVEVCRRELGRAVDIVIQSDETSAEDVAGAEPVEPSGVESGADSRGEAVADESEAAVAPAMPATPRAPMAIPSQHPLVKEAMELFGARIVDVQHRRPST